MRRRASAISSLEVAAANGRASHLSPRRNAAGHQRLGSGTTALGSVAGRQILNLTCQQDIDFSRDGRIFVRLGSEVTPWQVDPALEYRTLVYAASPPMKYYRPSIHRDGRVLAVTTDRGVAVWDLAKGAELAFLPFGVAYHSTFSVSGDLLTNGPDGVLRWPIGIDLTSGEVRLGPPGRLPLPGTICGIDEDRTGRIVAVAAQNAAYVAMPDRTSAAGPWTTAGASRSALTASGSPRGLANRRRGDLATSGRRQGHQAAHR